MFINEDIVAVVFRLINFMAVIALFFFVFKKYLAADIWYLITKKKNDRESLLNLQATLEKKQSDLDILLKEETVLCEQFRAKIDAWKKVVMLESDMRKKAHNEQMIFLANKNALRALTKEDTRMQNSVINSIIPELHESLAHYFNNEHRCQEYINSIVNFMDEKKQ